MYVPGIILGIVGTLFVEFVALLVIAVIKNDREDKRK